MKLGRYGLWRITEFGGEDFPRGKIDVYLASIFSVTEYSKAQIR